MNPAPATTHQPQQVVLHVPTQTSHGLHLALSVLGLLFGWIPALFIGFLLAPLLLAAPTVGTLVTISIGLLFTFGWPIVWLVTHDRNTQRVARERYGC
jgi:hypothetical protein